MSRHNRRRRRARHNRHPDVAGGDMHALQDDLRMSMGFQPPSPSFSHPSHPLSWQAGAGMHARTASDLSSHHASAISSSVRQVVSHGKSIAAWHESCLPSHAWTARHSHGAMAGDDLECDSICLGMTNVVEYLFDGYTDYDDEEMERKAASSRRRAS